MAGTAAATPMETTILDLKDDCIVSILKYLPARDLTHFRQVCSRFRNVLNDYGAGLYKRLELTNTFLDWLLLRQAGGHARTLFMSLQGDWTGDEPALRVGENISGLVNLERATLKLESGRSWFFLKRIIKELVKLPKIESVGVISGVADTTTLYSVDIYTHSDRLLLNYRELFFQEDMLKIGILSFGGVSIEKALADILPHLTLVREVFLDFKRPPREYLPIAQIPVLTKLSIFCEQGYRGPLLPFLSALAARHSGNLISFIIGVSPLQLDEVKEIVRIVSLENLQIYNFKPIYTYHLTELRNLERLSLSLPLENIPSSQLLAVIKACPKLSVLLVGSVMSDDFIYKALKVLQETRDPVNPNKLYLEMVHDEAHKSLLQDMDAERYIRFTL